MNAFIHHLFIYLGNVLLSPTINEMGLAGALTSYPNLLHAGSFSRLLRNSGPSYKRLSMIRVTYVNTELAPSVFDSQWTWKGVETILYSPRASENNGPTFSLRAARQRNIGDLQTAQRPRSGLTYALREKPWLRRFGG